MKLSRKWLNEFVTVDANDKDFAEAMTLSGSKVEGTEDLGAEISNVAAGRITAMERHPDSDHMWVCQLDVGRDEPVQIVTGAWNIHVGDMVPVALHKSTLPGGKRIEKGKLRGVLSNGMLCSLSELGLDERDFPYAVIEAAALLNDYKPIDPEKPSIPQGVTPGYQISGSVKAAFVTKVESLGDGRFAVSCDSGGTCHTITTALANIHAHDTVALDTARERICTLADLRAEQREFPHCIPDGIFVLQEDCKPGDDIRPVTGLDDHVVEFEITPNRPDCLSVIGLAREASATFDQPLTLHTPTVRGGGPGNLAELLDVETPDPDLCPRYTARMVRNVRIGPSPKWMRERLRAMGVRPINNIVDITNYVMLEYGQPMHAFDYRYVKGGKIVVRRAQEGEELTTLDGNVRKLTPNMLVIADETRAVGLAGIMGGENSEIVEDTADVVFESANFVSTAICPATTSPSGRRRSWAGAAAVWSAMPERGPPSAGAGSATMRDCSRRSGGAPTPSATSAPWGPRPGGPSGWCSPTTGWCTTPATTTRASNCSMGSPDMETIRLDGARLCRREEAMELLGQALELPAWWGRNLDALHDCLTQPGPGARLVLEGRREMEAVPFGRLLLRVLEDAAAENPHLELVSE